MVHGIEKIRDYLGQYPEQYCIIGGTACDLIMEDLGLNFRATRDMDIVLVAEAMTEEFCRDLWRLIIDGGYESKTRDTGNKELYRFKKPTNDAFPAMIELFSRRPAFSLWPDSHLAPLHFGDDISSLSAILMDDEYYALFTKGKKQVDGVSVLSEEYLLLLKMKAYIDFRERVAQGQGSHSSNLKKHKNDIFRLLAVLSPNSSVPLSKSIKDDVVQFSQLIADDPVDLKSIGINSISMGEAMELFIRIYRAK